MDPGNCYKLCNEKYGAMNANRLYCKKGCDAEEETLQACREEKCSELCIKRELGEDDEKKGKWTRYFSRAPKNSDTCMEACFYGCTNRHPDE